jgi:hypothetical protein
MHGTKKYKYFFLIKQYTLATVKAIENVHTKNRSNISGTPYASRKKPLPISR